MTIDNVVMAQQSLKIDELARRVLLAARWPTAVDNNDDDATIGRADYGGAVSPTPHLDELERALEIHLPPLDDDIMSSGNDDDNCEGGGGGGVRTCTLPAAGGGGLADRDASGTGGSNSSGSSNAGSEGGVWTWTPRTDAADNAYQKHDGDNAADGVDEQRTLEEMAPFSPRFYRAVGELAREAYRPGSVKEVVIANNEAEEGVVDDSPSPSALAASMQQSPPSTSTVHHEPCKQPPPQHEALRSLERYSLPRMMDGVRVTRMLLSLQEINVQGGGGGEWRGSDRRTFFELLLHYCEGMDLGPPDRNDVEGFQSTARPAKRPSTFDDDDPTDAARSARAASADNNGDGRKRVPILSGLFHHWSSLPRLEHEVRRLSRAHGMLLPATSGRYREFEASSSSRMFDRELGGGTVGDGGSTGGEWRAPASSSSSSSSSSSPDENSTSFLGRRALRMDAFKLRLERELERHIAGDDGGGNGRAGLGRGTGSSAATARRGGLVELFSALYDSSDAALRRRFRRWTGQWLRSFALGSGGGSSSSSSHAAAAASGTASAPLGPSFAAFCPSIASMSTAGIRQEGGTAAATPTDVAAAAMTSAVAGPVSIAHIGGGAGGGGGLGGMMRGGNPLGMENTSACGVEALLRALLPVVAGFRPLDPPVANVKGDKGGRRSDVLRPPHEQLLFDVLLPLHRPAGMVLWRDQTPLIGLYHEALVKCIGLFVSMDRTLVGPIVGALLHPDIWPGSEGGNTPKVVLMLHEVDTLVGLLSRDSDDDAEVMAFMSSFDPHLLPLANRLCLCISSENSRISERALQFFRNKTFKVLVERRLEDVGYLFLRALCRCPSREVPWNPTVRRMTLLVMQELEGYYKKCSDEHDWFSKACQEALSGASKSAEPTRGSVKSSNGTAKIATHSGDSPTLSGSMTTLRGAMGSWKPPPQQKARVFTSSAGSGNPTRQPPSTVTGVAPWAVGSQSNGKPKQPPLTVTGIAPWAVKKNPRDLPSSIPKRQTATASVVPRPPSVHVSGLVSRPLDPTLTNESVEVALTERHNNNLRCAKTTALDEVHAYMEKLKPKVDDGVSSDGLSSWAKAQMEESPVLFPSLKFHDLVFGEELGTGAFRTVKYARRIVKSRTRSTWPEYAVKIVSTHKIEELGYEQSVNREIAILRTLSHPGISRLVSSFRFRDGAYLILEYASGGDLHSLLKKNGSLDHDSTRFVIGSVAAALCSIHERGFVYADCKPENILITETGHVKVTDFGGCRPVTEDAKKLVKESSKNLLKQLRDGDWKTNDLEKPGELIMNGSPKESDEDLRIEGTTAYLPPEVVMGGYPTTAADVWALGCVLFQCISGRPPILEDTDDLTAQKIVSFDLNSDKQKFFGDSTSFFQDDSKALIQRMLSREALGRPDILQVADDDFFNGIDIFSLHKMPAHPLDVGSISPSSTDAKWTRRQFSTIWAPQPHAYNIEAAPYNNTARACGFCKACIEEGEEADEDFLPKRKAPLLMKIRE